MTLIILTVLAAAWLGYFALWFRHRRASSLRPGDGVVGASQYFDRSFDAAGRGQAAYASAVSGAGARHLVDLLEPPRTRQQAMRRRRLVARVIIGAALASLVAVPVFGPAALAVHVMIDVGLILFAFGSVHRQQAPDASLAEVRVLYPYRPVTDHAVTMPLRRVANG